MNKLICALALVLSFGSGQAWACAKVQDEGADIRSLSIGTSAFNVAGEGMQRMVTTLATIKNASRNCLENIVVEVKYFDANKQVIDTVTESIYGLVLTGENEVAFRVYQPAARPREAYASQAIRVVSADVRGARRAPVRSTWTVVTDFLYSWGPMLLLIVVWIIFSLRMKRKDSSQSRLVKLMEDQNALFARQIAQLERLAAAIEAKAQAK